MSSLSNIQRPFWTANYDNLKSNKAPALLILVKSIPLDGAKKIKYMSKDNRAAHPRLLAKTRREGEKRGKEEKKWVAQPNPL